MKKVKSVSVGLLALVLGLSFIFVLSGCNRGGNDATKSPPVLGGAGEPFFGAVLSKVIGGIVSGAEGKIGGEAMGVILQLLGWGGGDGDQAALAAMNTKLDQIIDTLSLIENDLVQLGVNVILAKDEVLANINDPTAAITRIGTAQDDLIDLATGKKAGGVNRADILSYANKVENVYLTENDVSTIHDAIIPPTIVKAPVLNNYVNYVIASPLSSLFDSYRGLELYFSQLVYNQIKGVNLVVEAKTAQEKAGILSAGSAKTYLDNFRKDKLKPEVDNFLLNARRLILSRVDLVNGNSLFLPADAQKVLERADFLAIQILAQDHFGLRFNLIGTTDVIGGVAGLTARGRQTALTASGTGVISTVPGKTYDHWVGNHLSGVSDYNVISYDFGALANGDYDILDKSGTVLATATVRSYTSDFVLSPTGTIGYGNAVLSKRVGAKEAFNSNASWGWGTWNITNATGLYATPDSRASGVQGPVQKLPGGGSFNAVGELSATFVYDSPVSKPMTIHYSAHAYGTGENVDDSMLKHGSGYFFSHIRYGIGLMDLTTNTFVTVLKTNKADGALQFKIDDRITDTYSFTPTPGHVYYLYFNTSTWGSYYNSIYGSSSSMSITEIAGNVYITF